MANRTAQEALASVCDKLRQQAARSAAAIQQKKRRADGLRAEIKRLKAEPNPDEELIKTLQSGLAELAAEIT